MVALVKKSPVSLLLDPITPYFTNYTKLVGKSLNSTIITVFEIKPNTSSLCKTTLFGDFYFNWSYLK